MGGSDVPAPEADAGVRGVLIVHSIIYISILVHSI